MFNCIKNKKYNKRMKRGTLPRVIMKRCERKAQRTLYQIYFTAMGGQCQEKLCKLSHANQGLSLTRFFLRGTIKTSCYIGKEDTGHPKWSRCSALPVAEEAEQK